MAICFQCAPKLVFIHLLEVPCDNEYLPYFSREAKHTFQQVEESDCRSSRRASCSKRRVGQSLKQPPFCKQTHNVHGPLKQWTNTSRATATKHTTPAKVEKTETTWTICWGGVAGTCAFWDHKDPLAANSPHVAPAKNDRWRLSCWFDRQVFYRGRGRSFLCGKLVLFWSRPSWVALQGKRENRETELRGSNSRTKTETRA